MAAHMPISEHMVDSDLAVVGIRRDNGGHVAIFIIKADDVADWIATYGDNYVEVPACDYREQFTNSSIRVKA